MVSLTDILQVLRDIEGDKITFSTCKKCINFDANCISGGDGHTCCTVCKCFHEHTYYKRTCVRNPGQVPEGKDKLLKSVMFSY